MPCWLPRKLDALGTHRPPLNHQCPGCEASPGPEMGCTTSTTEEGMQGQRDGGCCLAVANSPPCTSRWHLRQPTATVLEMAARGQTSQSGWCLVMNGLGGCSSGWGIDSPKVFGFPHTTTSVPGLLRSGCHATAGHGRDAAARAMLPRVWLRFAAPAPGQQQESFQLR